jgi:predicted transcriptional regulator
VGIYDAVTSEEEAKMVALRLEGKTHSAIANEVGTSVVTVCRHLNKKEMKVLIENIRNDIISETLGDAAENVKMAIKNYRNPQKETIITKGGEKAEIIDKQLRDHGFKASLAMMQGVGVIPSAAPATYIQNVYNDNRRVEIPVEIQEFLQARKSEVVIPAEYEDLS